MATVSLKTTSEIALVVAMTTDFVIGVANRLPWRLSADLKRFRALTLHHCVIMGRRTFESIGRPLPDRRSIVVTRGGFLAPTGSETASSLEEAIGRCSTEQKIYVIGGGELYRQAIPTASRIYLTLIELHEKKIPLFTPFEGDAYFPQVNPGEWTIDRLGRRNVARPKGRPAPIALRSVYFRFVDLIRSKPASRVPEPGRGDTFDLNAFKRIARHGHGLPVSAHQGQKTA